MKKQRFPIIFLVVIMAISTLVWVASTVKATEADEWRSDLYPENWAPCYVDSSGRFLQDFSFAGYHAGDRPLPENPVGPVVDVTQPPYSADNSGATNATSAIQQAIVDVGRQGGGTVYLPSGYYRLAVPDGQKFALGIAHSHVRLMGAGPDQTFLYMETTDMREKDIIRVFGGGSWRSPVGVAQPVFEPLVYPTQIIPLVGQPRFDVGDWVVVTHDTTEAWIADHNMEDMWIPRSIPGAVMYRKIIAVNREENTITIDAPTRYYLLPRDHARVYKVNSHIEEIGIENLSIGMAEHPGRGLEEEDYKIPGTIGYAVHGSHAIRMFYTINSWIRNVHTFKPEQNKWAHLVSNGIQLRESRHITIDSADFRNPQYRGSGGNGYMYTLVGNDSLIINSRAINGRHNYDFKMGYANGNVITNSYASSPDTRNSDFHMHLSPSNLIDTMTLDQERFDAGWNGTFGGTAPHALTGTHNVFWNIYGERYKQRYSAIVYSEQYGWGYVIGTRGPANQVALAKEMSTVVRDGRSYRIPFVNYRTLPEDYVEGVGQADTLQPPSLYKDQTERRQHRTEVIHCPDLDFRPPVPRIEIITPGQLESLTGHHTIQIEIQSPPTGGEIRDVSVTLDDEEIYRGADLSPRLPLDTRQLRDGRHSIAVRAISDSDLASTQYVTFSVANHWTFIDRLEPPTDNGIFGVINRDKTLDMSDGWDFDASDPQNFFGDSGRRVRKKDLEEYLTWEASHLKEFTVTVYSRETMIQPYIVVEVLQEDHEGSSAWQQMDFQVETLDQSDGGWNQLIVQGNVNESIVSKQIRLRILPGLQSGDGLQIGEIYLTGYRSSD